MPGVPNIFGGASAPIPLSQLDANFNTTATLGNAAIGLGNTTTAVGNLTLNNVTISGGTINATFGNANVTIGNTTVAIGATATSVGNLTLQNTTISSVATTFPNSYLANSTTTLGNTTVTLGSTTTSVGNLTVANVTITNFTESPVAIGNSSTTQTLALTNGTVQTVTMTGNCTFTMPTAVNGKSFLLFANTGAGNFTATFTSVKWSGNTAPTLTTTASKVDVFTFVSDGTSWYGTTVQNF